MRIRSLQPPAPSVPRILALNGAGHASRSAAAAHELGAVEVDHGAIAFGDPLLACEKGDTGDGAEADLFHLVKGRLVPLIGEHDARTERDEVTAGRPLLTLLGRAVAAATRDGLHRHAARLEGRENIRRLSEG